MKSVIYKGTLQALDGDETITITSDGKSPIEMPAAVADKLIARGRAILAEDQPAPAAKQVTQKKGKSADKSDDETNV